MTVVSGLPRAGTSLLMQIVEAAGFALLVDSERPADVDNPRGYFEYAPVKAILRDTGWLKSARGRAVKVVAPLLPKLPADERYDVLMVRRDVSEVLASQRAMLARVGAADDSLPEARLREILLEQQRAAEAWSRDHGRLLVVEHAALLASPEATCASVARFLGRPDRAAAMAACVDASLHRQRQG